MRTPPALITLLLLLVVVACSNEADRPEQTWPKDYDKTTCTEWNQSMSKTQKEAAAYDLVVNYLRRTDSDKKPSND
jgi:Flp pilus assembly protein TadD